MFNICHPVTPSIKLRLGGLGESEDFSNSANYVYSPFCKYFSVTSESELGNGCWKRFSRLWFELQGFMMMAKRNNIVHEMLRQAEFRVPLSIPATWNFLVPGVHWNFSLRMHAYDLLDFIELLWLTKEIQSENKSTKPFKSTFRVKRTLNFIELSFYVNEMYEWTSWETLRNSPLILKHFQRNFVTKEMDFLKETLFSRVQ